MAFALMAWKAHHIEKKKKRLIREKNNSLKLQKGLKIKTKLSDKIAHRCIDCKESVKSCCKRVFSLSKKSWLHRTLVKLRKDGTYENYLLKSFYGFVGGFILTYIFFVFFVFTLNFQLITATTLCSIFGGILTIGLAFNQKVRCVVSLILPQFFTKRGRQTMLAYGFILALTGPGKNTLNNMSIMSESMACGQEQMKTIARQILDVIKKPFLAIKEALKKVISVVKVIVKKIKQIFLTIKRIIMGIVRVIKSVFEFLKKVFSICNKNIGTPFQRCMRVFDDAVADCYAKLGPMFNWLCSIAYLVKHVCYIVKALDLICMLLDFVNDSVLGKIMQKVRTFVRHVKTIFYVRLQFSHQFEFKTTQSKSLKEISAGIVAEVKQNTAALLKVFDLMSCVTSLFFTVIIFNALYYRYKFLTKERFDNKFITKDFREIDYRRAEMDKETILPLNHRERKKYVEITSLRLVNAEKVKLSKSLTLLVVVTFKLLLYMLVDYGLYWLLMEVRYYGRFTGSAEPTKNMQMRIVGEGFLADLYRSVVKAFQPLDLKLEVDTAPCLPEPIPPNYDRYVQIGVILALCWIFAIFEPYGLRMRHHFMCYYHPARARERSIWLYNQIMRSRDTFLKFARRQIRRKFLGKKDQAKITCKEFITAKLNDTCLRIFVKADKQEVCVLCGEVFRAKDPQKPIRCSTPDCPGTYCEQCFKDLQNKCTLCLDPIQYGDLSDVDEEKDSSEDELSKRAKRNAGENYEEGEHKHTSIRGNYRKLHESEIEANLSQRERGGEDMSRSDYHSEDSSERAGSDGSSLSSLSCQFGRGSRDPSPLRLPFVDLERQRRPEYASMETFNGAAGRAAAAQRDCSSSEDELGGARRVLLRSRCSDLSASELEPLVPADTSSARLTEFRLRSFFAKQNTYGPRRQGSSDDEEDMVDHIELLPLRTGDTSTDPPRSVSSQFSVTDEVTASLRNEHLFYGVKYQEIDETSSTHGSNLI